jgi:AraC family transcriptional regulator, arabinose operon regulatory protein
MAIIRRRREGFRGEALLVVPEPQQELMRTHPLLAGLHVTHAGFFPRAPGHYVNRTTGSAGHVVIVCLRGSGWAEAAGRRHKVQRGDLVGLWANHPHRYGASDEDPWSIAWVHFSGLEADDWFSHALGRRGPLVACHTPAERLESLAFDRIHRVLTAGYGLPELLEAAAALRFSLVAVSRKRAQNSTALSAHERVQASIARLRRDWKHPHHLQELAASAGLSVTHYTALVRRLTGFSPIDFVIRLRIQHAATLLATSTMPIADIAPECGFDDPYYFSRSFSRVMGFSPREYRQSHRPATRS